MHRKLHEIEEDMRVLRVVDMRVQGAGQGGDEARHQHMEWLVRPKADIPLCDPETAAAYGMAAPRNDLCHEGRLLVEPTMQQTA